MDTFSPFSSKKRINAIFSDRRAHFYLKISNFIRVALTSISMCFGLFAIYHSFSHRTPEILVFFLFGIFVLNFLRLIQSIAASKYIITSRSYNETIVPIYETILSALIELSLFGWLFFCFCTSKACTESKFNVPSYVIVSDITIVSSMLPLFYDCLLHLIVLFLIWYVLYRIPVKNFKELKNQKYSECLICLEQFTPEEKVKIFKCKHYFHLKCVDTWIRREKTCPLCRKSITMLFDD